MTWDVPVKDDCPGCGQTMFKRAGKGFKRPYCINADCANFLPEEKRGHPQKAGTKSGEQKSSGKKTAAKKTAEKKTDEKKGAAKKTTAKKSTAAKKTVKKQEKKDEA